MSQPSVIPPLTIWISEPGGHPERTMPVIQQPWALTWGVGGPGDRVAEGWAVHMCLPSPDWLFATPWTIAHPAPLSMGFSRQEYWGGLPFPTPGDLPTPGIKLKSPVPPALQADSLLFESPGKSGRDFKHTGYWPQITEMHMKGMISISPNSCIFPYIEKPWIPHWSCLVFLN